MGAIKRQPSVRPGELHMYWGREARGEPRDIIYHSGDGVSRRDRAFLHYALGCNRPNLTGGFDKSFLDELLDRGYDLATLRFSIEKLPEPPTTPAGPQAMEGEDG